MKKSIKMWIARDEGVYNDDHKCIEKGKLHLFYDTPSIKEDSKMNLLKFGDARCICEVPSYMYPWIKEGDCYELDFNTPYFSNFKNSK